VRLSVSVIYSQTPCLRTWGGVSISPSHGPSRPAPNGARPPSESAVVDTRGHDAHIFIADDGLVPNDLALGAAASLEEMHNTVGTAVVDENLSKTHGPLAS